MKILITGITGFVGGHLVESLAALGGHSLAGLSRRDHWPDSLAHLAGLARLHAADLLDSSRVEAVIRDMRPEWVMHLAGYANTGGSFKEPERCWSENLAATRSLYEAIARTDVRPRILFVSTGLIYGDPDEPGRPCDERTTLKPASPYAASKAAADLLSYQVTRNPGLEVVRIRLFNQIGPRQAAGYALPDFARQIAAIEVGKQEAIIETGDLSARRDVTDIRDVVATFPVLLELGKAGEAYNAGTGAVYSMQELLDRLLALARVQVEVRPKEGTTRRGDTAATLADTRKLRATTGWAPRIPLDQSLADILDYWRKQH